MAATDPQDDTLTLAGTPNTTIGAPLPASPNVPVAAAPVAPPQASQTDLNIAHAMDRADLGNRFGFGSQQYLQGTENPAPATPQFATSTNDIINSAIENRMAAIASGTDPDHPALYVNPHRSQELQQEFHALGETRRRNALMEAGLADKRLEHQLDTNAANDFANYANGVSSIISSGLKPGDKDFQQAFLQNYLKFRDGASTKSGQELTKLFAEKHDNHAVTTENIQQALKSYRDATGLEPENVEVTATGGVNIRGKKDGGSDGNTEKIPSGALTELGKLNAQRAGQKLYLDKEVNPKKKEALQKNVDALDASIDAWHQTYLPKSKVPESAVPAVNVAAAAAAGTPDLNQLAKKALADPNAPEEVKAAARKRLGQ